MRILIHSAQRNTKPPMEAGMTNVAGTKHVEKTRVRFVKIDLIASNTFVIVRAGLQLSFRISKLTLPAESTLQW